MGAIAETIRSFHTFCMQDPKFHQYIKWHDDVENNNYGFLIADIGKFEKLVLPRCFKGCTKGSSFIKQLSNYGFKKIGRNSRQAFYVHRGGKFLRGHPELLGDVGRPEDHPSIPLPDPMHAQLLAQRSSITDPVTSPSNDCKIFDYLKSQTEELRSKAQVLEGIVDELLQRVQTLENTVSLLLKENNKLKVVVKDGRATADDPVRLLNQHCPPVLENPRNHATQITQIRMNEPNANPMPFVLEGMEFLITADESAKPMPHPVSPTTTPTGGDFHPVNDVDNPGSTHYQAGPLTDLSFNERIFHNARYSLPAQSSSNPFDLTAGAKPPAPLHRHHRLPIIDSNNQSRTSIDHSGKPMAQVPLARPQPHASRYVFSSNPFTAVTGQQQVASSPHELGVPQTISLPTLPASETPLYPPPLNGSEILSGLEIATQGSELWGKTPGPPSRVIGLQSGSMIDESYNDVAGELRRRKPSNMNVLRTIKA
ncbi:hypothetical protein FRB90_001280 [Tulasnella sp. 427]|nr:hypothetical protein FRB90_001280 [Tulasnella sp. 427]